MDLKLFSKNNVGGVATLFLLILLSQARFFDFLIDTPLGRAILILFILGISYTNKILGVVAVLFIIIAFNNSDIGYMEGFTGTKSNNSTDSSTDTSTTNVQETVQEQIEKKIQEKKDEKKNDASIEGYNMTEREGMMLRGKRSSEVPVFSNARNQGDDVEPSDKSVFSDNYSSI